jgi:hypothetical protein
MSDEANEDSGSEESVSISGSGDPTADAAEVYTRLEHTVQRLQDIIAQERPRNNIQFARALDSCLLRAAKIVYDIDQEDGRRIRLNTWGRSNHLMYYDGRSSLAPRNKSYGL